VTDPINERSEVAPAGGDGPVAWCIKHGPLRLAECIAIGHGAYQCAARVGQDLCLEDASGYGADQALAILREASRDTVPASREQCPHCGGCADFDIDRAEWYCASDCGVEGPEDDRDGAKWDSMARPARVLSELKQWAICNERATVQTYGAAARYVLDVIEGEA